jgi:molybdate transport system substrate-binding protein
MYGREHTMQRALLAAGIGFMMAVTVHAAEIKVIAAASMKAPFEVLESSFEKASGHKLNIDYGITGTVKKRVEDGEVFDVVIITRQVFDDFVKLGKIAPDSRTDLNRTGMAVAAKAGAPKPDLSTPEAFKQAILKAKSIAYAPEGLTGMTLAKIFERWGITEEMKAKTKLQKGPEETLDTVAAGDAELGLTAATFIAANPKVQLVGLFPGDLQNWLVNTAGMSSSTKEPEAARALIKFLTSPEALKVFQAKGFEPVAAPK